MPEDNQNNEQEAVQQLLNFVTAEMQAGSDKATIARKLEEQGLERRDAEQIAGTMYDEIAAVVRKEQFTSAAFGPGLLGGVLGALLGGGIWATIVILTDYELGIVAWGIGAVCGYGVVLLAKGRKGTPLQIVAVLTSVLGILLGKYFAFFYFLKDAVAEEYGAESAAELSMLSPEVVQYFGNMLPEMVSGYDALWVILAVITAWRIPKSSGIRVDTPFPQGPISPG